MKARIPAKNLLTGKQKKAIEEYAAVQLDKQIDESNRQASEVFILASACVLHQNSGYGKIRLERYMSDLQDFFDYLGGFDDAAKYRCLQILKDAGIEWKSDNGGVENDRY